MHFDNIYGLKMIFRVANFYTTSDFYFCIISFVDLLFVEVGGGGGGMETGLNVQKVAQNSHSFMLKHAIIKNKKVTCCYVTSKVSLLSKKT